MPAMLGIAMHNSRPQEALLTSFLSKFCPGRAHFFERMLVSNGEQRVDMPQMLGIPTLNGHCKVPVSSGV